MFLFYQKLTKNKRPNLKKGPWFPFGAVEMGGFEPPTHNVYYRLFEI